MDVHDFEVRFDGEGYRFEVFVNTNEDPMEVAKRLNKAARGQIKAACMVAASRLTPDEVKKFMGLMAKSVASGNGMEWRVDEKEGG